MSHFTRARRRSEGSYCSHDRILLGLVDAWTHRDADGIIAAFAEGGRRINESKQTVLNSSLQKAAESAALRYGATFSRFADAP
jgi:hypothetical protein